MTHFGWFLINLGGLVVSHPKHVVWWYMGGWVYGLPALNTYKTPLGPNTTRGVGHNGQPRGSNTTPRGGSNDQPGEGQIPPPRGGSQWSTLGGWYLGPGVFTGHLGLGAHNHPIP